MSETETTTASPNGKTDAKPTRSARTATAEPVAEEVTVTVATDDELGCTDCEDSGKGAAGLGLLICAVAGGLLYIGIDLVTGGGLSRRFGSAREDEGE